MPANKLGLVHVYNGDGKGKTSLALGMALRAAGQNFKILIIQFLKGGAYTGEFLAIKNFVKNIEICQYGKPCIKEQKQLKLDGFDVSTGKVPDVDFIREDIECGECRSCFLADQEEQVLTLNAFEHAKEAFEKNEFNIVVLDEILNAMRKNIITEDQVIELLNEKPEKMEIILTGRGEFEKLFKKVDYHIEMKMHNHPFLRGIYARRGIEY